MTSASRERVSARGIDRGALRPDADFTLIYDLLLGPLFVRRLCVAIRSDRTWPSGLSTWSSRPSEIPG